MCLAIHEAIHTIRLAKREDLEKVIGLLVNAAGWLQTKGTKQWNYYLTDLEGNVDEIVTSIENKSTYIVRSEEHTSELQSHS